MTLSQSFHSQRPGCPCQRAARYGHAALNGTREGPVLQVTFPFAFCARCPITKHLPPCYRKDPLAWAFAAWDPSSKRTYGVKRFPAMLHRVSMARRGLCQP